MKDENRTALLVRCTSEEAKLIHDAAKREHRTLSGYILHVVMSRIQHHDEVIADSQHESGVSETRATAAEESRARRIYPAILKKMRLPV